ncbi:MAG: type I restriction enzyme HsdR N-terminal domain-containing protein [Steroidobacteraceae bacterium]
MARPRKKSKQAVHEDQEDALVTEVATEGDEPENAPEAEEGKVFDYITGNPVKDTDKERVRQRIARAIIHEYGIAAEDMEPDFRVRAGGKLRKVDIAIFAPGKPHVAENLYRAVAIEKEPKLGTKGAYRMRDPDEAQKDFAVLHEVMAEVECNPLVFPDHLEVEG